MDQKINENISQKSVIYLIVCLAGILIFLLLEIVPHNRELASLEGKITDIKSHIEEQKALFPIYLAIKQKTQKKKTPVLPFPAKSKLAGAPMAQVNANIKEIAGKANTELVAVTPSLGSSAGSSGYMALEVSAKGNFPSFRKFLIGLEGVGYVEHIEDIQIQQNLNAMEIKIKLWVARS